MRRVSGRMDSQCCVLAYMYPSIRRAGIDVLLAGSLRGTEVTPDEGAQDLVAGELHDAAIERVGLVSRLGVALCSVVEVWNAVVLLRDALEVAVTPHHAQVPKPENLVFAIRDHVSAVTLCRNVCDAFGVANEHA